MAFSIEASPGADDDDGIILAFIWVVQNATATFESIRTRATPSLDAEFAMQDDDQARSHSGAHRSPVAPAVMVNEIAFGPVTPDDLRTMRIIRAVLLSVPVSTPMIFEM